MLNTKLVTGIILATALSPILALAQAATPSAPAAPTAPELTVDEQVSLFKDDATIQRLAKDWQPKFTALADQWKAAIKPETDDQQKTVDEFEKAHPGWTLNAAGGWHAIEKKAGTSATAPKAEKK
jgi:hypothetical protein